MKSNSILQADVENRGMILDPRTKLLLLITMAVFVLGELLSGSIDFMSYLLCAMPFILLLTSKQFIPAAVYAVVYISSLLINMLILPLLSGFPHFLILGTTGLLTRFLPSLIMGMYVMSTTTVSEFSAAMHRLHMSEKLIIPLSVMFRFFPTVKDEFSSINAAMRMRGIKFGGKNWSKMLEYRFIPLMTCSVQIGNELSAAALTRGLGGDVKRTNVCKIGFHVQDIVLWIICSVPYVCLILKYCGVI